MKYQFVEQHKQEFPIVVMCHVLARIRKWLLCMAKAPDPALANEKMLI